MFDKKPYTDVTQGIRGWFVILLKWYDEDDFSGYDVAWDGYGTYDTPQEAAEEARDIALAEDVDCAWYGPTQATG